MRIGPGDPLVPARENALPTRVDEAQAHELITRDDRVERADHARSTSPWPVRIAAAGLGLLLLTGAAASTPAASLGAMKTSDVTIGAPLVRDAAATNVVLLTQAPVTAPHDASAKASAIVPSTNNAHVPGSAALARSAATLEGLKRQGYWVHAIANLTVLSTIAPSHADASLARQKVGAGGFDAVVNGGFYFRANGKLHAAGPVVRNGQLETSGVPKSANRGAIAVRTDGTILIGRQHGATMDALEARFGSLHALMGGGALLIEDGVKVTSSDLGRAASAGGQQFDQVAIGLGAEQMRRTYHTVLGIRDGQLYLVGAPNKTGTEIRDQLFAAGFGSAIKLDGGSGGYYREPGSARVNGLAPLGFGLQFRR